MKALGRLFVETLVIAFATYLGMFAASEATDGIKARLKKKRKAAAKKKKKRKAKKKRK